MFSTLISLALQNLFYLALHLERNGAFPNKLSKEEERECHEKIAMGDLEARNKLVEHNLRLVAYIAKKNQSETTELEDLISIGIFGLIRAAETFKLDKNFNFSTYASKCIDNQIKMHFRKTKKTQNEIHISEPIDTDKNGNQITLAEIFRDPVNIEEVAELRIDLQKLYSYINEALCTRERQIVCMRYGLVHSGRGKTKAEKALTQQEVAGHLGISRSYVSRIEKKSLEVLKKKLIGKE